MKTIIIALSFLSLPAAMKAHGGQGGDSQSVRTFEIIVREDSAMTNTRGIAWQDNNRRLWGTEMFNLYRSTIAGKFASAGNSIISLGVSYLYDKLSSHRQDWMQAVQKECTYTKQLSMQTEIVDFYKEPSYKGAMDPSNIVFTGFGCRQTLGDKSGGGGAQGTQAQGGTSPDGASRGLSQLNVPPDGTAKDGPSGTPSGERTVKDGAGADDVFYVYCSLRTDEIGIQRITNHSKFEVVVDSIYFNPYICNIPNDSTAANGEHIKFDFEKRSNLTFSLTAKITSSWMNEAIQIYRDVPLGEFYVTAQIGKDDIVDSVFTYSKKRDAGTEKEKKISVTGDCFIVPRSYVGTLDGTAFTNAWGTGQYKVDMTVSESCGINREHYMQKTRETEQEKSAVSGKKSSKKQAKKQKEEWNNLWKEEWKIIKSRKKSASLWSQISSEVSSQWTGDEWITTFIEPLFDSSVTSGSNFISGDANTGGMNGMNGDAANSAGGGMTMPSGTKM